MTFDRYGYFGEVSYKDQNRFRPYSIKGLGQDLLGVRGLGSIPSVPSGSYRAQLGKLIPPPQRPSRELDAALFGMLDVQFAGRGINGVGLGLTDRELCNTLLTTSGQLATAAGSAFGPQPTRRAGETQAAYESRLRDWQIQTRTASVGGNALTAASNLCNLIDEAQQPAPKTPSSTSDWQLMQAREELRRLYEQQSGRSASGISTNTLLLVGGGLAAAAAVYFLFLR